MPKKDWLTKEEADNAIGRERVLEALRSGDIDARYRASKLPISPAKWRAHTFRNRTIEADPAAGRFRSSVEFGAYPYDRAIDGECSHPDGIVPPGTAEVRRADVETLSRSSNAADQWRKDRDRHIRQMLKDGLDPPRNVPWGKFTTELAKRLGAKSDSGFRRTQLHNLVKRIRDENSGPSA